MKLQNIIKQKPIYTNIGFKNIVTYFYKLLCDKNSIIKFTPLMY